MLCGWVVALALLGRHIEDDRQSGWLASRSRMFAFVMSIATAILFMYSVRPLAKSYGVHRETEVELGQWLKAHVAPRQSVLIDPIDYGYFAIEAAMARPGSVLLGRSLDPRLG